MKKLFILLFLLFPTLSYGAVSYERTPSGTEITSPVTFNVSVDDFEADFGFPPGEWSYWTITIYELPFAPPDPYQGECLTDTTFSHSFVFNLPVGYNAVEVIAQSYETLSDCENLPDNQIAGYELEMGVFPQYPEYLPESATYIFSIISSFTIVSNATDSFLGVTGYSLSSVVDYTSGLIRLILGMALATLDLLLPWIVAMVAIGGIIYFLYRAFRFFRH